MKPRLLSKTFLVLVIGFLICFFALGISYWSPPYSQVSLPNSLYGIGLLLVFLISAAIRVTASAAIMPAIVTIAVTAPSVVMARVIYEIILDPTSHNLWPFELIIASAVGGSMAVAGAAVGAALRRLFFGAYD